MFTRFFNLVGGKCRRWMRSREARDPESVYEAAIAGRIRRYQQLKSAAAGVIFGQMGFWLAMGIAIGLVVGGVFGRTKCADCATAHKTHQAGSKRLGASS